MKRLIVLIISILLVIGGVFMLGWIMGDNSSGAPAGYTLLYLIVEGAFFYHFYKHPIFNASYFKRIRF